MKTRNSDRTRAPAHMRAMGTTEPHPTIAHLWAHPGSTLYIADIDAVLRPARRATARARITCARPPGASTRCEAV